MATKPLTKEMILQAMHNTRSNRAAARYLNVSYTHFKKWAKNYSSDVEGKSLFDKHKNKGGIGIPKFMGGKAGNGDKFPILDIIEGRVSSDHFSPDKIKDSMIREGLIREICCECGFCERRVLDYRMPLLLWFKDNNRRNYRPENCVLICYNCYFLKIGDIFSPKQKLIIQDHKSVSSEEVTWELDKEDLEKLNNLVVRDNAIKPNGEDEPGMEYVSRK
jgi:hypothetical protein